MADMGSFKARITHIIKKTQERFKDGIDIFDFQGITTDLIKESLDEMHSQLSELEKHKETFEVVLLKRFLDEQLSKLKYFFDSDADSKNFNDFLNNIAKIKYRIRETYLLVVNDFIRTEAAITKAKDALPQLLELNEHIRSEQESIKTITEEIITKSKEYKNESEAMDEIMALAKKYHDEYNETIESLTSIKAENLKIQTELTGLTKKLEAQNNKVASQTTKTEQTIKNLEKANAENLKVISDIEELGKQSKAQSETIHKILADANRASMAGSFKEQMESLEIPQKKAERNKIIALIVIYITLIGIFTNFFGFFILPSGNEIIGWATRIAIISPLIWIAWNETRKQNILSRIKADYAYKYASAVAFEGYNRKAGEVSEDMQRKLLDIAINNLGNNPVRLFNEKDIHGSPLESVFKTSYEKSEKTIRDATSKILHNED